MSSAAAEIDPPGERADARGEAARRSRLSSPRDGQGDPDLLRALASPATYSGAPSVTVHETHASWVFVAGERAYKVKKPIALGFLDYSTLSRRRSACREEVRVNRELAPDVYLGVRAITKTATGYRLESEDAAIPVEYAVEMRTFSEADTVQGLIASGTLIRAQVRAVGRFLAAFHRTSPVVGGGGAADVIAMWLANVRELARASRVIGWDLAVARAFGEAFVRAHAREMEQRRLGGLIRDGHGDLRCEHVLAAGSIRVVDRVEFDPALRRVDQACDLAFLAMDLEAHDQAWAAEELVQAYRRAGMSPGSDALRSFYAMHWALVRAKVALIAAAEQRGDARRSQLAHARALWGLGERLCWRARRPLAIVLCGPAASGKSTLAAELSRRSGMAIVSSDLLRKSAAGLGAGEPAGPEHYGEQFTRAVYESLADEALAQLRRRECVIVDATCRSRRERGPLFGRLRELGTTMLVVRCEVPVEVAEQRSARRMHDAGRVSDATPEIVAAQYRSFEPLEELPSGEVLQLSTQQPLDAQVAEVAQAADRRLAA
jgi:aminoglycoside phosphotransferase family enzyme/predicted kinase